MQVYLDDIDAEQVRVQRYADASEDTEPFCQDLEKITLLVGTLNAYVYQGQVSARRPVADYTPRIIPAHANASVPLEEDFNLWYQ